MGPEADAQPDGKCTEPGPVRQHIVVEGRVQGVGFRTSCAREARRVGVGGQVRNLDNGTVEVVIEGDPEAVDRMVDWCRAGPPYAEVHQIHVTEEPASGAQMADSFAIT